MIFVRACRALACALARTGEHQLKQHKILSVSLLLASCALFAPMGVSGGLIIDMLEVPPAAHAAWKLASAGSARFAGGWHALNEPILSPKPRFEQFSPYPLRLQTPRLEMLPHATPIWRLPLAGQISVLEQLLFAWSLRVPVYAAENIEFTLLERMLLVPRQLRITITAREEVEVE